MCVGIEGSDPPNQVLDLIVHHYCDDRARQQIAPQKLQNVKKRK